MAVNIEQLLHIAAPHGCCLVAHREWKSELLKPSGPSGSTDDGRPLAKEGRHPMVIPRYIYEGQEGGFVWLSETLVQLGGE